MDLHCICICHWTPPHRGLWLLLLNRDRCWSSSTTRQVYLLCTFICVFVYALYLHLCVWFTLYFHLRICICLAIVFVCIYLPCFATDHHHGAPLAACALIVSDLCRGRCSIHFKYERLIQTSGDILNILCHYSIPSRPSYSSEIPEEWNRRFRN